MTFNKGVTEKTLPRRSMPDTVTPVSSASIGISASGTVSTISTGRTIQSVPILFKSLNWNDEDSICGLNNLRTFLETTVGRGKSFTVTPDYLNPPTNTIVDDLGVGATGATTFTYDSMTYTRTTGYYFDVTVNLLYTA